jgi:ankyrin repeat protein
MGGAQGTSPDTHQILDAAIMSVDPQIQGLFDAIVAADRDRVKQSIDAGVSVNSPNALGQTPLLVACQQRNLEIADLLVAAGAQMQVPTTVTPTAQIDALSIQVEAVRQYKRVSTLPAPNSVNLGAPDDEMPESPLRDRQIAYEDLIKTIHQPADRHVTEIETPLPQQSPSILSRAVINNVELNAQKATSTTTSDQNPVRLDPNQQDLFTDEESTYTFDLDAVFAAKDPLPTSLTPISVAADTAIQTGLEPINPHNSAEIFIDEEQTVISLDRPVTEIELESSQTYAFYLNRDLDLLTAEEEEADELAIPMGAWEEGETYLVDLDTFDRLGLDRNAVEPEIEVDGLLAIDDAIFPDGETYAIDLDDLNSDESMGNTNTFVQPDDRLNDKSDVNLERIGLNEQAAEPNDPLDLDELLEGNSEFVAAKASYEEGETYALDLDDLCSLSSYDSIDEDRIVKPERHLLANLDPHLFPSEDDDESEFEPDLQTSTDIFRHSKIDLDETQDDTLADGENAKNILLMAAIADGDSEQVRQLIAGGVNLDRGDWQMGYSPLGVAIDRGRADLVECLLTAGANPHSGSNSTTALGLAAERGAAEIIQMLLLRGINVNEPVDRDNWTALLSAIKGGHQSVVELLVNAGANVNIWSRGETPILWAAKCEEREIYQYLYPLVNLSTRLCADRDGAGLLQSAYKRRMRAQNRPVEKSIVMASEGNVAEVNRAIELGVAIDELGAQGHTALMAAAYYGHKSIVKILLEAGANPNLLSDDDGLGDRMTALMFAAGSFFGSNRQAIVKLLIANGADVDLRGAGGKTAIFNAALAGSGYQDCVELLIAAGADLDLRDDLGHTVLMLVAAAENYQILNLLIQAGASTAGLESIQLIQAASAGNIDRVQSLLATTKVNLDFDRGAAIGKAAAAGHTQIVKLLIQAGANVNLSDRSGFTPIASAAYLGHGEIVNLLVAAGANIQTPAIGSHCYSALEYAQMGLYQFDRADIQHAQIIRQLEQLEAL